MKTAFRFHRNWLLIALAAALLFALPPLWTQQIEAARADRVAALQTRKTALFAHIRQMESDAIAADELSQTIEAKEVQRFLAPVTRRQAAAQIEAFAAQARLAHLSYQIAPAQPFAAPDAPEGLVQSALQIEADAPSDSDILRFLGHLSDLPGRVDVADLSIERLQGELGALNVHMRLSARWINNGEKGP